VYLFFSVILGDIIETLKENGYEYTWGNVTVMLAEAFGFCWGVEKAVQIAYEARKQFPNHKIWITNEIIHNPTVNKVYIHFLPSSMISQLF
jgi:4-hydroxy-3-methylbut-2-enyl diphosphate reductase